MLFLFACGTERENWPSSFRAKKEILHDVSSAQQEFVEEMKMKCGQAGIGQESAEDPPPAPP